MSYPRINIPLPGLGMEPVQLAGPGLVTYPEEDFEDCSLYGQAKRCLAKGIEFVVEQVGVVLTTSPLLLEGKKNWKLEVKEFHFKVKLAIGQPVPVKSKNAFYDLIVPDMVGASGWQENGWMILEDHISRKFMLVKEGPPCKGTVEICYEEYE